MNQPQFHGIRHLLLDIKGTTCPVHFVGEVLFPYASAEMVPYLKEHQEEEIHRLLVELHTCWMQETEPEAIALRDANADAQGVQGAAGVEGIGPILFISDFTAELEAAEIAGLALLFSNREGNPRRDPKGFPSVTDFQDLNL